MSVTHYRKSPFPDIQIRERISYHGNNFHVVVWIKDVEECESILMHSSASSDNEEFTGNKICSRRCEEKS